LKDALTENDFSVSELEFGRVVKRLAGCCSSQQGQANVNQITVQRSETTIRQLQRQYHLVAARIEKGKKLDLAGGAHVPLPDLFLQDSYLDPEQLIQLHRNYLIYLRVKKFASGEPLLESELSTDPDLSDWERKVAKALDSDGSIREDATSELKSLHNALRKAEQQVTKALTRLMESHKDIVMDHLVTRRAGRFVIPIKQDFKGRIQCLVHDVSSSGATAYAEPIEIVDQNNRLQHLSADIHRKQLQLLRDLSQSVIDNRLFFQDIDRCIGFFDGMQARVRFAAQFRCRLPEISRDGWTRLREARHPLLMFQGHPVVPNQIEVDPKRPLLIVSGSNTGGKTVFLKMCGLLQLMNQAVIPVPAEENSFFRVFSRILTDIGDRQSIDESLSTYSGHMVRLKNILLEADADTLVLVDELGTGTEPAEGAAIAVSVAEAIRGTQCTAVITSHHQELSQLAHAEDSGVRLATVDFDEEALQPTYHLIYDIPGASHAIEIAKRIGLPDNLINRARDLAEKSDAGKAAKLSVRLTRQLRELQDREAELDDRLTELALRRKEQDEIAQQLKQEKKNLEKEIRQEFEGIISDFRKEKERVLHRVPLKNRRDVEALGDGVEHQVTDLVARRLETEAETVEQGLKVGDRVRHLLTGMEGEVVELSRKGDRACVKIRGKNMWVTPPDLEPINRPREKKTGAVRVTRENLVPVQLECNVVGAHVDDAVQKLEKQLDQAVLSGVDLVRVIHGHGTGRLRKGIRRYLEKSAYVERFEPDDGDGSTTAYLK